LAGRLVFEAFIFSIPFILFGLYLLATASVEQEGKRKWPARFENGVIIPARDYPCEQNMRDVGVPLKKSPGIVPQGAVDPADTRDASDIQARFPETEATDSADDPD
jgi:hypothetical protein